VPLRAGCRPHRRDDCDAFRVASFFRPEGKALERSATIKREATSTMDTWWFQPRKERPRSDPAQALPWRPRTPRFGAPPLLDFRTSWRRDMFAGNRGRGKVRRCLSPCGHSMSSQTASRCEGSTRSSCASNHTFGGERDDIFPFVPSRQVTRRKATSPDGVAPDPPDRHGVTDSASQQIQAPHRGRTGVSRRRRPQPSPAHAPANSELSP